MGGIFYRPSFVVQTFALHLYRLLDNRQHMPRYLLGWHDDSYSRIERFAPLAGNRVDSIFANVPMPVNKTKKEERRCGARLVHLAIAPTGEAHMYEHWRSTQATNGASLDEDRLHGTIGSEDRFGRERRDVPHSDDRLVAVTPSVPVEQPHHEHLVTDADSFGAHDLIGRDIRRPPRSELQVPIPDKDIGVWKYRYVDGPFWLDPIANAGLHELCS
jgi:hypothetical protein